MSLTTPTIRQCPQCGRSYRANVRAVPVQLPDEGPAPALAPVRFEADPPHCPDCQPTLFDLMRDPWRPIRAGAAPQDAPDRASAPPPGCLRPSAPARPVERRPAPRSAADVFSRQAAPFGFIVYACGFA